METAKHRKGLWVLRPLLWWLILVLVLYGIRTHERLMALTRLSFNVSLDGQPFGAVAALDGKSAMSGENISLGRHIFSVTSKKTDPFSTNFFAWYGPHDLGEIKLNRSMGTLRVQATPPASSITISGPEFATTLYNCAGTNLSLPTDHYAVHAEYPHWSQTQKSTVFANLPASCAFAPRFGALRLTCNKSPATYRLAYGNGQTVDSGGLPATAVELPVGEYEATVTYHHRQLQKSLRVETGATNDAPFQFSLGAVQLETTPAGATVRAADGSYLGQTPLLLPDMTPRTAQFNLSLSGYEPVRVALDIAADQTNVCRTNLASISYLSAMREARGFLAASNFQAVVQAAGAALAAKPDDADALALREEANDRLTAQRERQGRLTRPKRMFDSLCSDYRDADLFRQYELTTTKPARSVAAAIVRALTNAPQAFEIAQNDSPESDIYEVVARHTFSLGILGGTERDALIIVGQAKENEAQIWFKVMEYSVQHTVVATGLLNYHDNKRLVAVNPSRMQMNSGYWAQLREGVQIVTGKIQQAISQ